MQDEWDLEAGEDFGVEEVEFTKENAKKFRKTLGSAELSARWERIQDDVRFLDVVEMLYPQEHLSLHSRLAICPNDIKHSKPSFEIYKTSAYCHGCKQVWNSVQLSAKVQSLSIGQAIRWIEEEFDLPPLPGDWEDGDDDEDDDDPEGIAVALTFDDMVEAYFEVTSAALATNPDVEVARAVIARFFDAAPDKGEDPASRIQLDKCSGMLGTLGTDTVLRLRKEKFRV